MMDQIEDDHCDFNSADFTKIFAESSTNPSALPLPESDSGCMNITVRDNFLKVNSVFYNDCQIISHTAAYSDFNQFESSLNAQGWAITRLHLVADMRDSMGIHIHIERTR